MSPQTIGIIREFRLDENRTPLVPIHISQLKKKYQNLKIIVQSANHRCHADYEYKEAGAIVQEDLGECDLILGVKEIDVSVLLDSKKYIFFSHTSKVKSDNSAAAQGTPGMDKKELLTKILKKNITLIDYENIRDKKSRRYLGFGRFAGIVGCYNSLNLYLEMLNKKIMPRAFELNSYLKLKKNIENQDFNNIRILVTGDGRVAHGVLEFLKYTNIKEINCHEFKNDNLNKVFCNLTTSQYVKQKKGDKFNLENFIEFPDTYVSVLEDYLPFATMLISAHYWDPKSPILFNSFNIRKFSKLKVIGDITCDINGSIPTTSRSSTIENPYYHIDRANNNEIDKSDNSLAIMAVDNLPSELPKDSSKEFGDGIIKDVLPFIIESDDGRIKKATIAKNGSFCPLYDFLYDYIKV